MMMVCIVRRYIGHVMSFNKNLRVVNPIKMSHSQAHSNELRNILTYSRYLPIVIWEYRKKRVFCVSKAASHNKTAPNSKTAICSYEFSKHDTKITVLHTTKVATYTQLQYENGPSSRIAIVSSSLSSSS